ncbi:stage II sporulation protein E [Bacillus fonticola]|uniref:stage II sporulation protein E n=1 Tax=Bacillus fonticola TaxID=2728853 RepID=UPI00147500A1|nr:stage II sporulation protein E [Bacillus fonticola]
MEKVQTYDVEPVRDWSLRGQRTKLTERTDQLLQTIVLWMIQKGVIVFAVGFLLGRALILSQLMPFTLPFFVSVYVMKRQHAPVAMLGLTAGAFTISYTAALKAFLLMGTFLLIMRLFRVFRIEEVKWLPIINLLLLTAGATVTSSFAVGGFSLYDGMMGLVEGSLGAILTLIFLQSVPLLSIQKRKQSLKTEEIVCLMILLASVMTGTIGWSVYDLSLEHIMSRYLVLLFAFTAGATVGSTVGVVTGLVFSLANVSSFYQMSLLAFAGLLGGLLREGRKLGVAFGLAIATLLVGLYGGEGGTLTQTGYETLAAILLFLMTPNALVQQLAKYIPGTPEYSLEQQQYLRKMRDVTAKRVDQFSHVFEALSQSFSRLDEQKGKEEDRQLDYFLSNVTEKTCQTCFKKEHCWAKNFNTTYDGMKSIMTEYDQNEGKLSSRTRREWDKHCVRSKKVTDAILQELSYYQANERLKRQVQESRRIVAEQLLGVSEVMGNFAEEIQRERKSHEVQEEQVVEAIESFGLEIEQIEIYSLEVGNIDIEMTIPKSYSKGEAEKILAPLLSDIVGEHIVVHTKDEQAFPNGYAYVTFRSAKRFIVDTGVAHAAKGGGLVSGDSYSTIELGMGKYAVAISDGMGNGERAHHESHETLQLLRKILQSGMNEQVAIKSLNSILSLRTTDEIFSTLDLVMIDLQDARSKFIKIGSSPSFIKRGKQVKTVEASNLPIGIVEEFEVDVVSESLKAGDLLILMSDGVFEGPSSIENYDVWMKRKIAELQSHDPQEIADLLLEEVIRAGNGQIEDDMTIVVAHVKHNTPKWAAISASAVKKRLSSSAS